MERKLSESGLLRVTLDLLPLMKMAESDKPVCCGLNLHLGLSFFVSGEGRYLFLTNSVRHSLLFLTADSIPC